MENLVILTKVEGGKLVVEVPAEYEGVEVQVSVMPVEVINQDKRKFKEMPKEERMKLLHRYKGSARYPDADTNKYDVYEQ